MHAEDVERIVEEWREYKLAVPTFGAIILNTFMDKVLLVQVKELYRTKSTTDS
jgi:mRNA-decapping enzyme subunit 2